MNIRLVFPMLALAIVACGGGSPTAPDQPVTPRAHGLALTVTNNNQTAWATYTLPQTITVTAVDTFANTPLAGVVLDFVTRGNGILNGTVSQDSIRLTTGADGKASVTWRLGKRVGGQSVAVNVVSSPIASSAPSASLVSAALAASAPLQADATTPHFYDSNIPYEYVTTFQGWNPQVIDNLHINIPADTAWPISNVKLAEVLDSVTVVDSLVFTVDSIQWHAYDGLASTGNLPVPTCDLTNGLLTCQHSSVGYLEGGRTDLIDLNKPHRMGGFWLKLNVTTKAGAPVALHHLKNDGIRPASAAFWLLVDTGSRYLQ